MRRACSLVSAFCLAGLLPSAGAAQGPAPGTGLILGQAIDAYGDGVAEAVVTLNGGLRLVGSFRVEPEDLPSGPKRTVTTATGHFVFAGLVEGRYSLEVTKSGFRSGGYGRLRPDGLMQTLQLGAGERRGDITLNVWQLASISGQVVDEAGEPVVGVGVKAMRRTFHTGRSRFDIATGDATTDDRGVYRVAGLLAGEYVVALASTSITTPAPWVAAVGEAIAASAPLPVAREALMAGVRPDLPGRRFGDWVLQGTSPSSGAPVPPAPAADGRVRVYQTTFWPAAPSIAEAQIIALESGEQRSGTDLSIRVLPTAIVSGHVSGPRGAMPHVAIRLVPAYAEDLTVERGFDTAVALSDATGAFTILGVPPGAYILRAEATDAPAGTPLSRPGANIGPIYRANVPVQVGGDDVTGLAVTVASGYRISGRYEFEGTAEPPGPSQLDGHTVWVQPLSGHLSGNGTVYSGSVDADGTFEALNVPPGQYVIRSATTPTVRRTMLAWTFRDVIVNGRDVAGSPLDLTEDVADVVIRFTDRPSEIAGVARTAQGNPDPAAAVLVFSADPADWTNFGNSPRRLRNTRAALDGSFVMAGLPPGEYVVAAIPEAEATDWHDPRILAAAARVGATVVLGDGDRVRRDVTTSSVR